MHLITQRHCDNDGQTVNHGFPFHCSFKWNRLAGRLMTAKWGVLALESVASALENDLS